MRKKRYPKFGRKRAFSLVELLIVLVVTGILGGAAVASLWIMLGMFDQLNDYIGGREEIEFVAQAIGREVTNAGLGMPNNRQGKGSFAASFADASADGPVMSKMGASGQEWGGPVTLSAKNGGGYAAIPMVTKTTSIGGRDCYQGPELYYAWGVPTGVKAVVSGAELNAYRKNSKGGSKAELEIGVPPADLPVLRNIFKIEAGRPKNPLSWILFPTSRLPMRIDAINTDPGKQLRVTVAPGSAGMKAPVMGMDEIFLPRAARIYLDAGRRQVVQVVFGADYADPASNTVNVLAGNIVGLHFVYDPGLRMLSMYIAAQGDSRVRDAPPVKWPAFAAPLPDQRRVLVNRVDWRIRN